MFNNHYHTQVSQITPMDTQRFIATNRPGFAFDTKTGMECDMDGVDVPKGITLDIPRCATLAKRQGSDVAKK